MTMERADVRELSARELTAHLGEQLTRLVRQELAALPSLAVIAAGLLGYRRFGVGDRG
jgi:hypothetical protein